MQQGKKEEIVVYEEKAQELVSMTFALCEKQIAQGPKVAASPQRALAAAALCVQQSVKTFLEVTNIPKGREG